VGRYRPGYQIESIYSEVSSVKVVGFNNSCMVGKPEITSKGIAGQKSTWGKHEAHNLVGALISAKPVSG
jgi:hypothetical protein